MGLADLIQFNVWTLTSLDAGISLDLEGQFQPEGGAEVQASPTLSSSSTVGSERPAVQWVAGGGRSVRFRSSYVSRNQLDDIGPQLATLIALDRRDSTLGRAPRVSFQWGDLEIEGFARVRHRVAGWWSVSGWPMRVDFEIEILESMPLDLDGSGSSSGETQHLTLADGQTFETLAALHLGDPLRGDLIRRLNPKLAAGEVAGDRVKVLERSHPAMRGTFRPSAPSFLELGSSGELDAILEGLAADRGATTRGLSWARLPEVVTGEVGS